MSISKILVPIDFSDLSARTAQFGLALAEHHQAGVLLLHVDEMPQFSGPMAQRVRADVWEGYLHERARVLRERVQHFAERLSAKPNQFETRIVRGEAAEEIQRAATSHQPDLVIVAPTGAGSGTSFLMGSVADRVAANSPCPVLVLRSKTAVGQTGSLFRHPLLVLVDTELDSSLVALVSNLTATGAAVDMLWTERDLGDELEQLPGWASYAGERSLAQRARVRAGVAALTQAGLEARSKSTPGDPASLALAEQAASNNDLIIVSKPRQGGGRRAASAALRLVHHAPVPVVVASVDLRPA